MGAMPCRVRGSPHTLELSKAHKERLPKAFDFRGHLRRSLERLNRFSSRCFNCLFSLLTLWGGLGNLALKDFDGLCG
ncbi:hypothetical protein GUJ93_ZPchr0007g4784 [Zizania palustris]|uniref:Uncharacterized protein n=1 Tax=Zizania palustris TaxID=103762 RepID=A0A8J5SVU6_ZIZPA|nr:hypothetical protein GUJ93_ZPchr0007g4784 [Zizania palustris]